VGSLTLSLAQPQLLSEQLELLANTGGSNGAGGRAADVWTVQTTVSGRRYTRATRAASAELMQGGKPDDANMIEIALDTVGVNPAWRVRAADGSTYEILTQAVQGPITFVRARQVP